MERVSTMEQLNKSGILVDMRRTRLLSTSPENVDYDPRDHRAPTHAIKLWMAYFDLLRLSCSTGMLGMPLATSQMGIVLGPVVTLFTGFLIISTHKLLARRKETKATWQMQNRIEISTNLGYPNCILSCFQLNSLYEIARQLKIPYISYRYGFRIALLRGPPLLHWMGKHGPTIIAMFMVLTQLGLCSVMVIFTTDSLRDLMDWQSSLPSLVCLFTPFLLMEFFMEDLSKISYLAMSGNFLNLAGISIIFWHIITDYNGEKVSARTSVSGVLFGFGTMLFNLSAVGVVLSIDRSLIKPKIMTSKFGVLNVGIICPTILATFFGSIGYYTFGTMEENILRSLPYDETSTMVAVFLYTISVAFAYPLQCYPAILTIVEVIKYHDQWTTPSEKALKFIERAGRPLFVTLSFLICYLVPFQGPLVAFVGNVCTAMLQLVFPALMDLSLRYPFHYGENHIHLYKDIIIISLGLICSTVGAYRCGYLIRIRLQSQYSPNSGFF